MPRKSNKSALIEFLVSDCVQQLIDCDSSSDEDEIIDETLGAVCTISTLRYCQPFNLGSVVKSRTWWTSVLPNLDENRFKVFMRVTRYQFGYICEQIKNDQLFSNAHSKKQFSVELQLAIFLYRLGCSGEGGTIVKIANLFGCGDGGTIDNISSRVMRVFLTKREKYLYWPNDEERKEIVMATSDELPHCCGYLDGSEIPLAEKPLQDWESYYSRKQQYSIKAQAVCDYKLKIRHLVVGPPGSVHDSRIFKNSSLWLKQNEFFSGMQWLAADTAYQPSSIVICPFKKPRGELLDRSKTSFNKIFSSYRVRIEHCFGILKERFNSLKQLKIRINGDDTIKYACQWITVACIIHNILMDCSDGEEIQELIKLLNIREDDEVEINLEDEQLDTTPGTRKRKALMEIILQD